MTSIDHALPIVQVIRGASPELLHLDAMSPPWRVLAEAVILAAEKGRDRRAAADSALTTLDGGGLEIRAQIEAAARLLYEKPDASTQEVSAALDDKLPWLPSGDVLDALDQGEIGDAELLAKLFSDRIVYDHPEKQWYLWNGQHWEPDTCNDVVNLSAGPVAAQYLHLAAEMRQAMRTGKAEDKTIKQLEGRAWALRHRSRISNVLALAQSRPALALSGEEWDADPLLLGVANGTIDLRTATLRPGRPRDYLRTPAPTQWEGIDAPAPRWEQFLLEIFAGSTDLVCFVQRFLGYGITGLRTEHILPVLWGAGRNGKDTLLEVLSHILGDMAQPVGAQVLLGGRRSPNAATPHLYGLRHLRLAFVSETNEGAWLDAGQVKLLTGGGKISCRPLYGKPVVFEPRYLLMLVTNFRPHANADDYALWKRLLLIPFEVSFVDDPTEAHERKRDPHLADKLKAEAPGILAWLVSGCLEWQAQGLNPPAVVKTATLEYQSQEDTVSAFVDECCIVNSDAQVGATDLYTTYAEWSGSMGIRAMSGTAFGIRIGKRFERKHQSGGNIYLGIGLLDRETGVMP